MRLDGDFLLLTGANCPFLSYDYHIAPRSSQDGCVDLVFVRQQAGKTLTRANVATFMLSLDTKKDWSQGPRARLVEYERVKSFQLLAQDGRSSSVLDVDGEREIGKKEPR